MKNTILIGRHEEVADTAEELVTNDQFEGIINEFREVKGRKITFDFGYCRGGDLSMAFVLIEHILASNKYVVARATGDLLASSAAYIFLACKERLIKPTDEFRLKIHPVQLSLSSAHLDDMGRIPRKAYRRTCVLNRRIATLLGGRTKLTVEQVNQILTNKGDTSFTWRQAIEAGLASGVVK